MLVLFQAITLNVAINSHNKVLMVVMVSNQVIVSYKTKSNGNSRNFDGISVRLLTKTCFVLSWFSLLNLKGVFSRSLRKTICFKCLVQASRITSLTI